LAPCGKLSWLGISFWVHVNMSLPHLIITSSLCINILVTFACISQIFTIEITVHETQYAKVIPTVQSINQLQIYIAPYVESESEVL